MARSKWISFGAQQALQRAAVKAAPPVPPSSADAKKFGLENFGNTCYANSVLQALYFCAPFRELLLQDAESFHEPDPAPASQQITTKPSTNLAPARRKPERKPSTSGDTPSTSLQSPYPIPSHPTSLHSALRSLFLNISSNPGERGSVAPRAFIDKLKELHEFFRGTMQQDAHEFLNVLLNTIVEDIEKERKHESNGHAEDLSSSVPTLASRNPPTVITTTNSSASGSQTQGATLIHKLFEGTLTSETRCLTCETVSSRDESFLDLSIDIEQNSSVTACLRQFSASEMLCQRNKFFCDACCDLQEAEKRMKIKKLPNVLALHLKRFKYQEDGRYIKLTYRVAFPFELRLFNTVDDIEDVDRLYKLFAIVVHIGNGPHQGHYVSIVKTSGSWFIFDDETVSSIPEADISKYFGDSLAGSAYVLYYQAVDIDLASLGLRPPDSTTVPSVVPTTPFTPAPPAERVEHILPPGLNIPSNARPESIQPSASNNSSTRTSIPPSEHPNPPVPPLTLQTSDADASVQPPPSSPLTPSGIGSRLFHSIRRVPSLSAGVVERPEAKGSTSERSPRASSSTPSLGPPVDTPIQQAPPPVPPLPSNLGNISSPRNQPPLSHQPTAPDSDKGREKEKEKEKEKTTGWPFKKRKSLRALEKTHIDFVTPSDLPPSPSHKPADDSHWYKPSSPALPRLQRRPSESASPVNGNGHLHHLDLPPPTPHHDDPGRLSPVNGDSRRPSTSRSTSPVSTVFSSTLGGTMPSRPSTAMSTQTAEPARKLSLLPSPLERGHTPFGRKRSLDFKAMSPTSPSWPHASFPHPEFQRNLPPPPSTPKHHRNSPSNASAHMATEVPPLKHYDTYDGSATATSPWHNTFPSTTTPSSATPLQPPLSIGATPAHSSDSNNSLPVVTSGVKRATRKLSFTANTFFGRKDKQKEKQREKERLSPAAGYAKG